MIGLNVAYNGSFAEALTYKEPEVYTRQCIPLPCWISYEIKLLFKQQI